MSENNDPLSFPEIAARDRSVRRLLELVTLHPEPASQAGADINSRIEHFINSTLDAARRSTFRQLNLLSIAQEFVLDRERMSQPIGYCINAKGCSNQTDSVLVRAIGELQLWQARAFEALGYYDLPLHQEFPNFVGHLENAKTHGFDLAGQSAVAAYAFSISTVLAQGKVTESEVLAQFEPDRVIALNATRPMGLFGLMRTEIDRPLHEVRSIEQWWQLAILQLLCVCPEFNGRAVGIVPEIPWQDVTAEGNPFAHRSQVLERYAQGFPKGETAAHKLMVFMLERTAENLQSWSARAQGNLISQRHASGSSAEPLLSPSCRAILQAMLRRGAVTSDARLTSDEIGAKAADQDGSTARKSLVVLKGCHLVESTVGSGGGYWLTPAGIERATRLEMK